MEVNVKGFIRNLVSDVLEELLEKECLYDSYELLTDEYDEHFEKIKQIAIEVTEKHLDCLIDEKESKKAKSIIRPKGREVDLMCDDGGGYIKMVIANDSDIWFYPTLVNDGIRFRTSGSSLEIPHYGKVHELLLELMHELEVGYNPHQKERLMKVSHERISKGIKNF